MNNIPKVRASVGGTGRVKNSCNGNKNGSGCHIDRLPFCGGRHAGKKRRAKLATAVRIAA